MSQSRRKLISTSINYIYRVAAHSLGGPFAEAKVIIGQPFSRPTRSVVVSPLRNQIHGLVQYILLHLIVQRSGLFADTAAASVAAPEQLTPDGRHAAAREDEEEGNDSNPHLLLIEFGPAWNIHKD